MITSTAGGSMSVLARIAIVSFLTYPVAAATLCERPSPSPDDPYSYVVAYIAASAQLQHACELALQNGRPPMGKNLGETLLQLKRAKQSLACAKQILAP